MVNNILKNFNEKMPDRTVIAISEYKNGYLIIAEDNELGSADISGNIYYLNDKKYIEKLPIMSDFNGINKSLDNPIYELK